MTNKEKARVAWEQDLEVIIFPKEGNNYRAFVRACDYVNNRIMVSHAEDEWEVVRFSNIANIGIIDFVERRASADMEEHNAIYAKLAALSDRLDDLESRLDMPKHPRDTKKYGWQWAALERALKAGNEVNVRWEDGSGSLVSRVGKLQWNNGKESVVFTDYTYLELDDITSIDTTITGDEDG